MKRFVKIMAILCVLGVFFAFTACDGEKRATKEEKTVSIIVAFDGEALSYSVTDEIATLEDAMNALKEKNEQFTFVAENSEYGLFVTEVCGRGAQGNEFWGFYTDRIFSDANGLPNAYEETFVELSGVTYYMCAQGISNQAVADGETILFYLGKF